MSEIKFVDVKGVRTRYIEAGSGEPLVLYHGADFPRSATNAEVWGLNIEGLARTFHVFAVDKLGHGYTDNPKADEDYTFGGMVQHGYDFLQTLSLGPANLVGHSRGGYLVTRIALEHPEAVKNIVIVDSNSIAPDYPANSPFYVELAKKNPHPPGSWDYIWFYTEAHTFSTKHMNREWIENMVKIAQLPKSAELQEKFKKVGDFYRADIEKAKAETIGWLREGRLKVPTLIIWGFNDPSAPLELGYRLFSLIASQVPRSQLHVFNEAGHHSFREHPEDFNRVVTDFLTSS
ncbi:MAG: alpha/beta hydrolase [Deltaproteobacteria bacterium]|nr:alpha/beta hydrolase [Deltaproteobacteria bacterium]